MTRNYKTPRGEHRQNTLRHTSQQDPLWSTSKNIGNKSKNKQIIFLRLFSIIEYYKILTIVPCKKVWYLNQDHSFPLPSQFSEEIPLQIARAKNTGLCGEPSPYSFQLSSQEDQDVSVFSSYSQLLVAEAKPWAVQLRWGFLSSLYSTLVKQWLYVGSGMLKILGPQ